MKPFLSTTILRHRRENLKKCSLRGLEQREDMLFLTYPKDPVPFIEKGILLSLGAPPLTNEDRFPLFLIDGTWKYAAVMERQIPQKEKWVHRSLPSHFRTAYPRKQTDCADPDRGLASVEALFIAYHILGYDTSGLLDYYHWKDDFLTLNSQYLLYSTTSH